MSARSGHWSGQRSGRWSGLRSGQWSGLGSVRSGHWSGQRSGRWSGQRSGGGSVRSAQWFGQCLVSLANGGQSLFSLANGGQSLLGLANTYLWVLSVWPMPVLGMVGLANTCLGSRTSSWVGSQIICIPKFVWLHDDSFNQHKLISFNII